MCSLLTPVLRPSEESEVAIIDTESALCLLSTCCNGLQAGPSCADKKVLEQLMLRLKIMEMQLQKRCPGVHVQHSPDDKDWACIGCALTQPTAGQNADSSGTAGSDLDLTSCPIAQGIPVYAPYALLMKPCASCQDATSTAPGSFCSAAECKGYRLSGCLLHVL